LQNDKISQIEFDEIKENQIFLFNGLASSEGYDYVIVFGFKRMKNTNIIETYHNENCLIFRLVSYSEKKLKELSENFVL
jgi:hypothetical protein